MRWPPAASHAVIGPISPMSPTPQLVVDGQANSGTTTPLLRRPVGVGPFIRVPVTSVPSNAKGAKAAETNPSPALAFRRHCFAGRSSCDAVAIEAPEHATGPVLKARLRHEQTHDKVRFALEVIKIAGMGQNPVVAQQTQDEVLLRHNPRHLKNRVPSCLAPQHGARRCRPASAKPS